MRWLLLLLFIPSVTVAQNLVPNSSFEQFSSCPTGLPIDCISNEIVKLTPWFQPTCGTADGWNACQFPYGWTSVGPQDPRTGNGFIGLHVNGQPTDRNYREYASVLLIDTLEAGVKYCVSAYISSAEYYDCGIDKFGFWLRQNPINNSTFTVILGAPQVVNSTGIRHDTTNWMLVSGSFTAIGNEQYLIMGNFFDSTGTTSSCGVNEAYYFVDDVSVMPCDSVPEVTPFHTRSFDLEVYPNPTRGTATISGLQGPSTVTVLDVMGREIASHTLAMTSGSIDLSGQPSGVYFLNIETEEGATTRKVVKR